MTTEHRPYRKKLAVPGLIYMAGKEHSILVEDLSLTGFLATFKEDSSIVDAKVIFDIVKESPLVDIYLPEMKLAGTALVIRVETVEQHVHIALEFKDLTYEVYDIAHHRKVYRKNMNAPGLICIDGDEHLFSTENASIEGLMIRLSGHIEAMPGSLAKFVFEPLSLSGTAKIVWVEHQHGATLMGLCYEHLERSAADKLLPRFYS